MPSRSSRSWLLAISLHPLLHFLSAAATSRINFGSGRAAWEGVRASRAGRVACNVPGHRSVILARVSTLSMCDGPAGTQAETGTRAGQPQPQQAPPKPPGWPLSTELTDEEFFRLIRQTQLIVLSICASVSTAAACVTVLAIAGEEELAAVARQLLPLGDSVFALPLEGAAASASIWARQQVVLSSERNRGSEPKESPLRTAGRRVYEALASIDRGDFRWEFLVPWVNRTLTRTDKLIVCSTFVGLAFTLQNVFDPSASVAEHLSYIAQFFSYTMADPIGFRLVALLTSALEIAGALFEKQYSFLMALRSGAPLSLPSVEAFVDAFGSVGPESYEPLVYNALFIVINAYYVMRWLISREEIAALLSWPDEQQKLYERCFHPLGFGRAQFHLLLRSASFEQAGSEGEVLTEQGVPLSDLFVCINGSVQILVDGLPTVSLAPYQLIGEASLLEYLQSDGSLVSPPAARTAVATPNSAFVRWSQKSFYEMQRSENLEFGASIQMAIARTLATKLRAARTSQQQPVQLAEDDVALIADTLPEEAPPEVEGLTEWPATRLVDDSQCPVNAARVELLTQRAQEQEPLQRQVEELTERLGEREAQLQTRERQVVDLIAAVVSMGCLLLLSLYGTLAI